MITGAASGRRSKGVYPDCVASRSSPSTSKLWNCNPPSFWQLSDHSKSDARVRPLVPSPTGSNRRCNRVERTSCAIRTIRQTDVSVAKGSETSSFPCDFTSIHSSVLRVRASCCQNLHLKSTTSRFPASFVACSGSLISRGLRK